MTLTATCLAEQSGCSAGFGMGMAMYLGPTLVLNPRSVLKTCDRLPTRFRRYTCVHGSGHAFMRGFHSQLSDAVRACRTLGPTNAPDCAQGAYHDYWISLSGGDDTTRPKDAATSPRTICGGVEFVRPCWYRFFWEREPGTHVRHASDMLRLCKGVTGFQRAGCMSGASLMMSRELEPVDHARECGKLSGTDTLNCLRGVDVPLLVGNRFEELRLIRTCADLPLYDPLGLLFLVRTHADGRHRRQVPTRRLLGARHDPRARDLCRRCGADERAAPDVLLESSAARERRSARRARATSR